LEFKEKIMTDLVKFLELYKSVGVEASLEAHSNGHTLKLEVGDKNIEGYPMFYTSIFFDLEGKFLSQGIWG